MTKQEILEDMLAKNSAYVEDWQNKEKWDAYYLAWKRWREVKGDE